MGMLGFDSNRSSATQTTQTVSGQGQLVSGKGAQIGTLNLGAKAKYTEAGAVDLSGSKNANVTLQNLDAQVVSDALAVVSDIQQQSSEQAAQNAAVLKASNDNLVSLLGGTPVPTETSTTTLITWLKRLGLGALVVAVLYFIFRRT